MCPVLVGLERNKSDMPYEISQNNFITLIMFCFPFQGSGVVKAGFAGDQIPKYHFPN